MPSYLTPGSPKARSLIPIGKSDTALDTQSPGFRKLGKFCKVAAKCGLRLGWMDTVCINKESSTELDESIRSMFKWYKGSEICIAYLADTTTPDEIWSDQWFTRGRTLQELLAPYRIKFFSKNWGALCNSCGKSDKSWDFPLLSTICLASGVDEQEFLYSPNLDSVPIWRKMQWASNRKVTREEDTAYSLMGIFNISMPTGYGEGAEHAFLRLVREILNSKATDGAFSVLEIANWSSLPWKEYENHSSVSSSRLIPSSPRAYARASLKKICFYSPSSPITLSHMGLRVVALLMPSAFTSVQSRADLNHFQLSPKGGYSATLRSESEVYSVLDRDVFYQSTEAP